MTVSYVVYERIHGYKYRLLEQFQWYSEFLKDESFEAPFFQCDKGHCTAFKGYAWDGVSGPAVDTKKTKIPGLKHDISYQAIRLGLIDKKYKSDIDKQFHDDLERGKVSRFIADIYYRGVRWFGSMWGLVRGKYEGKRLYAPKKPDGKE